MQRSRGRAHHDRTLVEGNFIGKPKHASPGHDDEFGEASIAIFADHFAGLTELLTSRKAMGALSACGQIMNADAVARLELLDTVATHLDRSGNFVSECQRQRIDARFARAIMRIRMTNA